MSNSIETLIISGILHVPDYQTKVFPYIKADIFEEQSVSTLFNLTKSYYDQYSKLPTQDSLTIELDNTTGLSELVFQETKKL